MSDLYDDIEVFIRRLRQTGLQQLPQSLEDAVWYRSTSGEILTNVACLLDRARRNVPDLPEDMAAQRDAILDRTTRGLREVGQR